LFRSGYYSGYFQVNKGHKNQRSRTDNESGYFIPTILLTTRLREGKDEDIIEDPSKATEEKNL
jgi:hypothetical protein